MESFRYCFFVLLRRMCCGDTKKGPHESGPFDVSIADERWLLGVVLVFEFVEFGGDVFLDVLRG